MPKREPLLVRLVRHLRLAEGGCWVFDGGRTRHGYGRIGSGKGREALLAHRVIYQLLVGEVGDKHVCHACDNPPCCNPEHLFLGTHQENMADMRRKGRSPAGERNGASTISDAQVREIRDLRGRVSQRAIAARYGISQQAVSKIHAGLRRNKETKENA